MKWSMKGRGIHRMFCAHEDELYAFEDGRMDIPLTALMEEARLADQNYLPR